MYIIRLALQPLITQSDSAEKLEFCNTAHIHGSRALLKFILVI